MKAEPLLTIDPAMRLRQEVETLRVERNAWESLQEKVDKMMAYMPDTFDKG